LDLCGKQLRRPRHAEVSGCVYHSLFVRFVAAAAMVTEGAPAQRPGALS
jgi:hypothetical protein